jgi:hypothetical protein
MRAVLANGIIAEARAVRPGETADRRSGRCACRGADRSADCAANGRTAGRSGGSTCGRLRKRESRRNGKGESGCSANNQ